MIKASFNMARSSWLYWLGVMQYTTRFMAPYETAARYFSEVEQKRAEDGSPSAADFLGLLLLHMQLATKGTMASLAAMNQYHMQQATQALLATFSTLARGKAEDMDGYSERHRKLMELVVHAYPKAIQEVAPEYGIHTENGGYIKVAETDRFDLYQVLPLDRNTPVRANGKPVLIIPPYVLGANVLSFLPGENKSYIHAFANTGIPTYIRLVKDIDFTPAVQRMSGEDDIRDTRFFSQRILERHGRKLTLNGYCQGGFMGVLGLLSGELDDLVDALITCVAPMDGSRSKALVEYIEYLPERFRNLGYSLKPLPNGNEVVDGQLMGLLCKLRSIESEAPLSNFYRDLMMFDQGAGRPPKISKTAAAINHWLTYDRTDLPLSITQLSYDSYTKPVSKDGTLPITVFGRSLNFKRLKEKGIKWLICIAEKDELTDEGATLAALDFVDAEVTVFPKGHASIATSWSQPASQCAIQYQLDVTCPRSNGKSRGPVRFQLDLDAMESNEVKRKSDAAHAEPALMEEAA